MQAEVAHLVEHQPSKLRVASSSLVFRSRVKECSTLTKEQVSGQLLNWAARATKRESIEYGSMPYRLFLSFGNIANVAQSVEHIHGKDEVTSSILVIGS